jgi:carbamate kinase
METEGDRMDERDKKEILLIALGGNALVRPGQSGTAAEQIENLQTPLRQIARLSRRYRIIITHGNGPQVGNLLLQQESCDSVPKMPLEILVAMTQGQIGYMIESVLDSALGKDSGQLLVSLISYVVVDGNDPAFADPSKPIGPFYTEEEAAALPWPSRRTARGYRRVVASPEPVTIVEKREIRALIDLGFIVICCGGGGIPVTREGRTFHGVDAVIDKDLASARLAEEVGADLFLIATDVPGAALHFGTPKQAYLREVTTTEASRYLAEGHFAPGSMGPKIEAAVRFVEEGGRRATIAFLEDIEKAVAGQAGTDITRSGSGDPAPTSP